MKAEQVDKALHQKFVLDGERLVFWHDPDAEFSDYLADGLNPDLGAVTLIHVNDNGGLPTKLLLEKDDPSGKYLLYRTGARPPAEQDWLFDIRAYSAEFHADIASLWLEELGLTAMYLRGHLRARSAFLGNQDRRKKLRKLLTASDDDAAIDLKMMAVLAGSRMADVFSIVRAICHTHVDDEEFDLAKTPAAIERFEKMGLLPGFWALITQTFGYRSDKPSLSGLVRRMFISEFLHEADAEVDALAHLRLPEIGRQNATVCLTQWRDSSSQAASYDAAALAVEKEQKLSGHLASLEDDRLAATFTFLACEFRVVSRLKDRVLGEALTVDAAAIEEIAHRRQGGHWLSGSSRDEPERDALYEAYDAVVAAAELFALSVKTKHELAFDAAADLLSAYVDELYLFDQHYRHFHFCARPATGQGWDLLKTLSAEVERVYDEAFLRPLGLEWGRLLDAGFLTSWSLAKFPPQQDFYANTVARHLAVSDRKRAYVIISDAFRYEAAAELTAMLNGVFRNSASLSPMLGVLPSYTTLGMASLLPHDSLEYADSGDVLVDGNSVASTDARDKQLAKYEGMACRANDLIGMKKEEARDFIQDKRVVYIYHNVVDARGDNKATEGETFDAVDDCFRELIDLVSFCINKLSAASVWVTADHGFLFQEQAPNLTDKSALGPKPTNVVKMKKRYVIGRSLGTAAEAHRGTTDVTAGTADPMQFWIPRGANRFHFVGGARFVHGGAMPQEVVVPLITVTQLRGKKKEASRTEKVSVQVLGTKHKITTPKYRFEIIQTEAVGERRLPLVVRAAVYDGAKVVTSVDTVTFDSPSPNIEDRKKSIRLVLASGEYDKSKPYRLVLRDAETDAEVQSMAVVIDRSFADDF